MLILVFQKVRREQKLQSSFVFPKNVPEPKVLTVFFLQLRSRVRLSGFLSWPGRSSWWCWMQTPSTTPHNWGRRPSPPSLSMWRSPLLRWVNVRERQNSKEALVLLALVTCCMKLVFYSSVPLVEFSHAFESTLIHHFDLQCESQRVVIHWSVVLIAWLKMLKTWAWNQSGVGVNPTHSFGHLSSQFQQTAILLSALTKQTLNIVRNAPLRTQMLTFCDLTSLRYCRGSSSLGANLRPNTSTSRWWLLTNWLSVLP